MKRYLLLVFLALTIFLPAQSQSKLIFKDKFMFTESKVFNAKSEHLITSLIDTGSSLCIIDSTFAIDSCGVLENELKPISVNKTKTKITSIYLDSLLFSGVTYHNVYCLVADLAGIYKKYAPRFIIGANILKYGAWKFDMKKQIIEPYNHKSKNQAIVYKWKNHEDYSDVAMDYIILDSKVNGKETRFAFDTGSKNNKLPNDLYEGKVELIQKETANIGNDLSIKTAKMYRNVIFKIKNNEYKLDFINTDDNIGLLNIEFLNDHSFILNYRKKTLVILEE